MAPMRSLVVLGFFVVACSRSEPEPIKATTTTNAAASASSSATVTASSTTAAPSASGTAAGALPAAVVWTAPARFVKEPGDKPMRLATYHSPKAGTDTEETTLAVAQAGGGLDANIERWMGQFSPITKKTRTERTVGALTATIVEAHGTFTGMSGGPKDKHMLLGAIFPVKDGNFFFFKLVGGEASVEAARADFDALVASVHAAP